MEEFRKEIQSAISKLRGHINWPVQIFSHNDCDGLTAMTILENIFSEEKFKLEKTVQIEKPFPSLLERVLSQKEKIIVFTDLCGRICEKIKELNMAKNLVVILDHHVAKVGSDPKNMVYNLDCDLFGINGGKSMSASSVCYVFAEEFVGLEKAEKLGLLGILGSIGDKFFGVGGELVDENQRIFQICKKNKLASFDPIAKKYINKMGDDLLEISEKIDVLGAVGYLSNGPKNAVKFLSENKDSCSFSIPENKAIRDEVEELKKLKEKIFKETMDNIDKISFIKDQIMMIDVGETFNPMGVKMIGVFLGELSRLNSEKYNDLYLFGAQTTPTKIPGFGDDVIPKGMQKISGRVGLNLLDKVNHGTSLPLDFLMPQAASLVGGFSDACHPHAAAIVLDKKEQINPFVEECSKILKGGAGIGVGRGFGKTILSGGDCGFLMWGVNGLVGSLPFETICLIERVEKNQVDKALGYVVFDKRQEVPGYKKSKEKMQLDSIKLQINHWKLEEAIKKQPISITFRGSLLGASGDGASAAHCVSFARALNYAFNLNKTELEINHSGWIGEHAYHGKPSGVDNTVSTFGGLIDISFSRETQKSKFERVKVVPVEIVLAHSGVHADTSSLLGICTKMRENDQENFDSKISKIKSDVQKMRDCFEKSDWKGLGELMNSNHETINAMGLSHEKVNNLCKIGKDLGAVGAKVTGGGLGGYCLFLTPGKELQEKVRDGLEKAGGKAIFSVTWPSIY